MAKLIPPVIPSDSSRGERDLFKRLREDPRARDWTIFHSIDVRRHKNQIEGEIDLIIAIPRCGILCIEVKACDVWRENGIWHYSYGTSVKGPFKQVSRSMHSLREWLGSKDSRFKDLMFFSAVVFTEINFIEESPEWLPWQFLNRDQLAGKSSTELFINILEKAHDLIKSRAGGWYKEDKARPSTKDVARLSELLRHDFVYSDSERLEISRSENNINKMTEEQLNIANQYEDNPRILIKGPAGTGKTYIGLDAVKWVINSRKSVALICFNSQLGGWLSHEISNSKKEFEDLKKPFYCGTLHRLMLDVSGLDYPQNFSPSIFWTQTLPQAAIESMLSKREVIQYDHLIIDEAQDLMTEIYLDFIDLILKDGLSKGSWLMLGDFERQAIYTVNPLTGGGNGLELLRSRVKDFSTFNLRTNCRNLISISNTLTLASALVPGYKKVLGMDSYGEVDPKFYADTSAQVILLEKTIVSLLKIFRPEEIVVLSMKGLKEGAANNANKALGDIRLVEYEASIFSKNQVRFSTVRMFKGLEANAIILTDIDDLETERAQALLYTGMSRAKIHLSLLIKAELQGKYRNLIISGLQSSQIDP